MNVAIFPLPVFENVARLPPCLIFFFLCMWAPLFAEAEGPLPQAQEMEAVYRLSEEMVRHGMHGHVAEMVQQGKVLRDRAVQLRGRLRDGALPAARKKAALISLNTAIQETEAVISHGERKRPRLALAAARNVLFRMKQARQRVSP